MVNKIKLMYIDIQYMGFLVGSVKRERERERERGREREREGGRERRRESVESDTRWPSYPAWVVFSTQG